MLAGFLKDSKRSAEPGVHGQKGHSAQTRFFWTEVNSFKRILQWLSFRKNFQCLCYVFSLYMWHSQGERKMVFVKQLHFLKLMSDRNFSIPSTHQSAAFIRNKSWISQHIILPALRLPNFGVKNHSPGKRGNMKDVIIGSAAVKYIATSWNLRAGQPCPVSFTLAF